MDIKKKTKQSGAVLLIAIMVSSVVLAVGLGIYQRTYKQLLIGSFWKQIQIAFAAADAGLECALYWDKKLPDSAGGGDASCFGSTFVWADGGWTPGVYKMFPYPLDMAAGGCVQIKVTKMASGETRILARGYNDACTSTSSRRVERALLDSYY